MSTLRPRFRRLAAVLLLTAAAGCRRPEPPPASPPLDPDAVDGTAALEEVRRFLAVGPRVSGTDGARDAAHYLERRLRELEVAPSLDVFTQPAPGGDVVFRNVLAVIPGRRPCTVVLLSHYDTKAGISPAFIGANDSGSSTGLLLVLARELAARAPLPCEVLVAFVDGEECVRAYGPRDGLHGSRRLASHLRARGKADAVRGVLVLDMIGDADLRVTLPRNGTPALMSAVFDAAREDGSRSAFGLARGTVLDDHVPFLEAGMPAVDLIDFEFGSTPGRNDYWHTDEDTFDKLSAESLETVGRVVIRVLNRLMADPAER